MSEPLSSRSAEQNVGTRVGVGERPQSTGAPAKPNHILWPLASFPRFILCPRGVSKAIPLCTHQPWLVSLGEGHFIHKNASLSFFKNKQKNSCSTMVICIQKGKNLMYTAQSPKKLEALVHTQHPTKLKFSLMSPCSVLAFRTPPAS